MRHVTAILLLAVFPALGQRTDSPRHYLGVTEPLTNASSALPEDIARQHLRSLAPELSLTPADLESVYTAKQYRTGHNGVTHIVFRQRFRGVDVLNAEWVVNLDRDGRVLNAGGNLYPAPQQSRTLPPRIRAFAAVRSAVAAVNPKLKDQFAPFESSEAPRQPRGIRFARGPLARDVEGSVVWYAHRGALRPAWNFFVADTDFVHRYSVTVDDESQTILGKQPLTYFQSQQTASTPPTPRGLVFDQESPQPNPTPGVRLTAPPPIVPRVLKGFQGDPVASPFGWTDGKATAGNNVVAGENLAGTNFVSPTPALGVNGDFSFPLQLGTGFFPLNYPDAAVTNLFYWMNRAHDLHYQYGFDEQSGNFQLHNFGRGGVDGDPVFAYAHYGAQLSGSGEFENSFFSLDGITDDGAQPEVAMFMSGGSGALNDVFTDGSYDSMVMVHEYTHGVSTRLARQVYSTFQGASMGEAWSDFYGIEYTTPDGAPPDGVYPGAQYFDQSWGTGDIRSRPYSTDMSIDPVTFANLGHVIEYPEVHADGEIWMEALWEARANLIAQFGESEGRKRIRQLVMDGMKLAVPLASMVDMRDAILLADRVDYKGASQGQLWAAFAKRGLGALAYSDGGNTVHVMSSFDLPSTTGQLKFYDNPMVIGEPVRVVLQDSNYTQPSVLIQLTGSSGDLENLILRQKGSVYEGSIATAQASVTQGNFRLDLASTDQISAYYVDMDTGSGASKLIQTTIQTMMPYAFSTSAAAFAFSGERRVSVAQGSYTIQSLPFSFPFFDKTYGSAVVFANGLIAFEFPATPGACADSYNLRNYRAITPLWTASSATSLSGSAQSGEGLYVSTGPDSITFRWAGQFTGIDQTANPTNYAATLFSDGRIQFNYGTGNQTVDNSASFNECGPAVLGLGNGHDVYSTAYASGTFENLVTVHFDPPFHNSSLPSATIATPKPGDHVQDILLVSGTASDSAASVSALDVFVDGVNRAHLVPSGQPLTWSTTLNIAGLGIAQGDHTLAIRVTNARGGFVNLPATPLTFTVDPGTAYPPVIAVESPADGATIKGNLALKGYAYDANLRISAVDTLIDGFVYGPTTYGLTRSDICNPLTAKPSNCPAVGFTASLPTVEAFPPIPDGPHTLQVRVHDQTGRLTLYPATPLHITVQNGTPAPVIGVLEAPASNATLSGTVALSGYMYSAGQKMAAGYVIVDGLLYGSAKLGVARPDVCPSLPNADACPNIGFTFNLDTTKLLNGPHVIGIEGVNARGDYAIFPSVVGLGIDVFVQN
jgi:hypothetical protein